MPDQNCQSPASQAHQDLKQIREMSPLAQSLSFPDPSSRVVSVALLDRVLVVLASLEPVRL